MAIASPESRAAATEPSADRVAREKVARHTARPRAHPDDPPPRSILIIPPCTDLAAGFEAARHRLASGARIRLVGNGVTLERSWPAWAREARGLWLTELTAYRSTTRWDAAHPLREALAALADDLFAGTLPGLRGSEVFYPHIGLRAFASVSFLMPVALGLVKHHALDDVSCTVPDWPGLALYRALGGGRARDGAPATPGPGRSEGRPSLGARVRFAARVIPLASAGWGFSLAQVTRTYVASRVGLKELRRRRGPGAPPIWLHLSPDFPRINAALIEAARGRDVGVLLHGNLGPGEREEARLSHRRGDQLWPGVHAQDPERVRGWATTSSPPNALQFAAACLRFTRNSAVATARLCRTGPLLRVGAGTIDLTARSRDLVKVLTLDMARTCLADAATARAVAAHRFGSSLVLSSGALAADIAVVMRRLQRAGATTIDFTHGWCGEPEPFTEEPPCDYRCVWASTDVARGKVGFLVGGMPLLPRLPRPARGPRRRVLVLTNYVHRDDTVYQIGLDPYMAELLEVVHLRAGAYDFRLRPHPADRPDAIARATEGLPAELSGGRPLAEDLAWAEVVVSSMSTTIAQALLLDLPVLVHLTPDVEDLPRVACFAPERVFFRAAEGAAKLDAIVWGLDDPATLSPERSTRTLLFGESMQPAALAEAIAPLLGPPR